MRRWRCPPRTMPAGPLESALPVVRLATARADAMPEALLVRPPSPLVQITRDSYVPEPRTTMGPPTPPAPTRARHRADAALPIGHTYRPSSRAAGAPRARPRTAGAPRGHHASGAHRAGPTPTSRCRRRRYQLADAVRGHDVARATGTDANTERTAASASSIRCWCPCAVSDDEHIDAGLEQLAALAATSRSPRCRRRRAVPRRVDRDGRASPQRSGLGQDRTSRPDPSTTAPAADSQRRATRRLLRRRVRARSHRGRHPSPQLREAIRTRQSPRSRLPPALVVDGRSTGAVRAFGSRASASRPGSAVRASAECRIGAPPAACSWH